MDILTRSRETRALSRQIQARSLVVRDAVTATIAACRSAAIASAEARSDRSLLIPRALEERATPAPLPTPSPVETFMAVTGMAEADLNEFTDDLIATYRHALATDDDQVPVFAAALKLLGRHFAHRLGPKAAGIISN